MYLPQPTIFRALTRPTLNKLGLPHKMSIIMLIAAAIFVLNIGRGRLYYWAILIPMYIGLRELAEWDPNFLRLFELWARTKFKTRWQTHQLWGGSHLVAMPCGVPKDPADVAGVV